MKELKNQEKIKRVSAALVQFCNLLMFACVLGGLGWLGWIVVPFMTQHSGQVQILSNLGTWVVGPVAVIEFIALGNFKRFFQRLKDGHIFDGPAVGRLAAAGKWKLAGWALPYVAGIITVAGLAMQGQIQGWHETSVAGLAAVVGGLGGLLAPLAIIFVAWLLREGQNMQEEQELTV
jgi:flagellar biogenesis protein FliO